MNGWMWRPAEAEAINRQAPRSKGGSEPRPKQARLPGLGQPAQAHFWPGSAPSHSPLLLGQLLTCSLMHVGPWRRLLHGLDRAPCRASFNIFCPGPWSFTASCFGPWALWSHVHDVSGLVSGFMMVSWSARWTYPESLPLSASFLRKQQTPKSTCESELDTSGGLVPLVRISNTCKCDDKLIARCTKIDRQHTLMLKPCSSSSKSKIFAKFGNQRCPSMSSLHLVYTTRHIALSSI
jgi:hypothetical protein